MEMNLRLNNDEGMKLLTAVKSVAAKYNRNPDSSDTMEEYGEVVEAALTAMGINVSINGKPKVEDENKYCDSAADCYFCNSEEEEEDDDVVYSLASKRKFIRQYVDNGHAFEEACLVADILFGKMEGE